MVRATSTSKNITLGATTPTTTSRQASEVLYLFLLIVFMSIVLWYMGRVPWCACKTLVLWKGEAWSSHTSQHFLDPYSFSHVQHGIIFFFVLYLVKAHSRYQFWVAALLEIGWEILENSSFIINRYRSVTASLDYFGDSIANSVGDVLSCLLGFYIASKIPWRITVGLYIFVEILMLLTIRDCLTLNVLMLIWPIDAIKAWQVVGQH